MKTSEDKKKPWSEKEKLMYLQMSKDVSGILRALNKWGYGKLIIDNEATPSALDLGGWPYKILQRIKLILKGVILWFKNLISGII